MVSGYPNLRYSRVHDCWIDCAGSAWVRGACFDHRANGREIATDRGTDRRGPDPNLFPSRSARPSRGVRSRLHEPTRIDDVRFSEPVEFAAEDCISDGFPDVRT